MADPEATEHDASSTSIEPTRATVRAVPEAVAARRRSSPALTSTDASIARSPVSALHLDEVVRVRLFLRNIMLFTLGLLPVPFVIDGQPTLERILLAAFVTCAATAAWLWRLARDPTKYTESRLLVVVLVCAVTGNIAVLYWGIFSAAQASTLILIYVFARGESARVATATYLACAIPQLVFTVVILGGIVDDPGLFHFGRSRFESALTMGIGQVVLLFTFMSGRRIRVSTLAVVTQLEEVVRQVSQREALLEEAREELEHARKVGGAGRFTDQVVGGYRLGDVIGRGGMGEVYEARGVADGAIVAVKLVRPDGDESLATRFMREARIAGSLEVDNVVRVLSASRDGERPLYLVMERLSGRTLSDLLRERQRLSIDETIDMLRQVGRAIDAAGAQGIVHRDIKPGNLMLTDAGVWKVLDFGVARLVDEGHTLTAGELIGTPAYMAPEQALGKRVDPRADLYALAAVAYRAVTGQAPFASKDTAALLYQVVHDRPRRPSTVAPLPARLDAVILRGLAKDPAARYANAAELVGAIAATVAAA